MIHNEEQLIGLFVIIVVLMIMGTIVAYEIEDNTIYVNFPLDAIGEVSVSHYQKDVIMNMISLMNPRISYEDRKMICREIMIRSERFGLHPFLITGVIAAESSFRPQVVSRCKARGLMQITDTVAQMMGIMNPYDIRQNIYAGTKYLQMLFGRFFDEELVLAAYNAGPTRVARLKRIPKIRETLNYVKKVLDYQSFMQSQLVRQIQQDFMKPAVTRVAWDRCIPKQIELKQDTLHLIMESGQVCCESRRSSILV